MDRLTLTRTQRSALVEALGNRFPCLEVGADAHAPDFAAAVVHKLLTNSRYKSADEP
jgi:hypothetical protein